MVTNLKLLVVENTHLSLLVCFHFCSFYVGEFLRIWFTCKCALLPFSLCYCTFNNILDLKFKNMFSKITTSLLYHSISVSPQISIFVQFVFYYQQCQKNTNIQEEIKTNTIPQRKNRVNWSIFSSRNSL